MQKFNELGLSKEVTKALAENEIVSPTNIQEKSIPLLLKGDVDFIGLAQTGTGKTAAFGLPLIELIDEGGRYTQSLVIAPTRELAVQTAESIRAFSKYKREVNVEVVYGGNPISPQIQQIKRNVPKILVATPGRLIDLIERKVIKLDNIKYVVLDEADEILNMGFKEDIDKILSFTPKEKKTWLFSATMPREIRRIVKEYMTDPVEVTVSAEERVNKNIVHQFILVNRRDRKEALRRLIDANPDFYGLVFCRTKIEAQELAEDLVAASYEAGALHGDLSQRQRNDTMKRMKAKVLKILIATDVAARGIDVDDLTHVIHYNLPDDAAFYTHRSGRTARAGKTGKSIVIANPGGERKMKTLSKTLGINFERIEVPSEEEIGLNRLNNFIAKIMESDASEVHPKLLTQSLQVFAEISKEDLIGKLLAIELKNAKTGNKNLNAQSDSREERGGGRDGRDKDRGGRDKRDRFSDRKDSRRDGRKKFDREDKFESKNKDRKSKKPTKSGDNFDRYFINVGSMDKVDKGGLLGLICNTAGIDGNDVGSIELGSRHSYFEVEKGSGKKVKDGFKKITYKGRELRVNRDGK